MNAVEKGELPFVRVLIPLILGILPGYWFESSHLVLAFFKFSLVVFFVALFFFITFYKEWKFYKNKWLGGFLVFLIVFGAGYIRTLYWTGKLNDHHFSKSKQDLLIVTVNSEPRLKRGVLRCEAVVTNCIVGQKVSTATGKLLVTIKLRKQPVRDILYGTQLLIPSNYTLVEPPHNPSEFDYREYMAKKGVYHQIHLVDNQAAILQEDMGNSLITYAIETRTKLVKRFTRFLRDKDAAAVASTLILGYRADLREEIVQAYSSTGTMHVLSVSGMHVGIIFFILAFLLRGLDRNNVLKAVKAVVIIILILVYTLLSGLSAAACRAALMISFLILGKALNRNSNPYNLLAISAVILLLYNPLFLVDLGFQLSYLAVLGLIYLYPKLYSSYYAGNQIVDKIWSYSALSISAQIATFPLGMFYFHQFPLYFLISNMVIVLPVALIMYLGMLFILIPFEVVLQPLGWLLEQCVVFSNYMLFKIETIPGSISGVWLSSWEFAIIYLLVALLLSLSACKDGIRWKLRACMILVFFLIAGRSIEQVLLDRNRQIIVYSLRNSLAIGLLEGRQAHIITNLKEQDKSFLYSVMPYLEERRTEKINTVAYESFSETKSVFINGRFIQFRGWKAFIWDEKIPSETLQSLEVNTVIVRNNSIQSVEAVTRVIRCRQIVFDGSNYDSNINRWVVEAEQLNLPCHVLKGNFSLLLEIL